MVKESLFDEVMFEKEQVTKIRRKSLPGIEQNKYKGSNRLGKLKKQNEGLCG